MIPADDEQRDSLLSAYLDGELDGSQRGEVDALLKRSPEARDRLAKLRETVAQLRALPRVATRADLGPLIQQRIAARRPASVTRTPNWLRRLGPFLAISGTAAAVAILSVLFMRSPTRPTPAPTNSSLAPPPAIDTPLARAIERSNQAAKSNPPPVAKVTPDELRQLAALGYAGDGDEQDEQTIAAIYDEAKAPPAAKPAAPAIAAAPASPAALPPRAKTTGGQPIEPTAPTAGIANGRKPTVAEVERAADAGRKKLAARSALPATSATPPEMPAPVVLRITVRPSTPDAYQRITALAATMRRQAAAQPAPEAPRLEHEGKSTPDTSWSADQVSAFLRALESQPDIHARVALSFGSQDLSAVRSLLATAGGANAAWSNAGVSRAKSRPTPDAFFQRPSPAKSRRADAGVARPAPRTRPSGRARAFADRANWHGAGTRIQSNWPSVGLFWYGPWPVAVPPQASQSKPATLRFELRIVPPKP